MKKLIFMLGVIALVSCGSKNSTPSNEVTANDTVSVIDSTIVISDSIVNIDTLAVTNDSI